MSSGTGERVSRSAVRHAWRWHRTRLDSLTSEVERTHAVQRERSTGERASRVEGRVCARRGRRHVTADTPAGPTVRGAPRGHAWTR